MHLTYYLPEEGTLELTYMWLPTFIGMNEELKGEIESIIAPLVIGQVLDDELLRKIDEEIIKVIVGKYSISGLDKYLSALSGVEDGNEQEED